MFIIKHPKINYDVLSWAFQKCRSLKSIIFPSLASQKVYIVEYL